MARAMTTTQFVERALEVWGSRWDYSGTCYKNMQSRVTIVCPTHGEFSQLPQTHLKGSVGCKACKWGVWDIKSFVAEATRVHGDRYSYTASEYAGAVKKIIIGCKDHGPFQQLPSEHTGGSGCPKCAGKGITTKQILEKFTSQWGSRYDYSLVRYVDSLTKVRIICRTHGEFEQEPKSHWQGRQGCPDCLGKVHDTKSFVAKSSTHKWGSLDYSNTTYRSNQGSVTLTCNHHGVYETVADYHVQGNVTCPGCKGSNTSKKEKELLSFIEELTPEKVIPNARGVIPRQELDVYIPALKLAVEFNGVYWHSEAHLHKDYHYKKMMACRVAGVRLVQVWEDDWDLREPIVREHLRQVLQTSNLERVSARKTTVREVQVEEARGFMNTHHIQGFVGATHHIGLKHHGDLVAVASLTKSGGDFILSRFATSVNVRGGHSKLVTYFERNFSYGKLLTFADLTFGSGGLYRGTGWVEDGLVPPDYSYLRGGVVREHKFNYRLKRFQEDPTLIYKAGCTERELARINKLLRVYDAGKIRFVKPHPSILTETTLEERHSHELVS